MYHRNTIETAFAKLFGSRSDAALKAIVEGPAVREALTRAENEEVKRRAALVKQLAELPKHHEKRCSELNAAVQKAREDMEAAHAAVAAATTRHSEAYVLAVSAGTLYASEQGRLTLELEQSADPRIINFERECANLRCNDARHAAPVMRLDTSGDRERLYHDASNGTAACDALQIAILECRALRLQALTSIEITAALRKLAAALTTPLAAINLKPPTVEGDELASTLH